MRIRTQRFAAAVALVVVTWTLSPAAQQPPVPAMPVRDPALALACAPAVALLPPEPSMRILGSQEARRALFGTGDALVVAAGTGKGLRVGQEYFVRRVVDDQFALRLSGFVPTSIKTAGWIRIVDIAEDHAIATVTYACDGIVEGDYLEPYVRPVEPAPLPAGEPDYQNSGVLIMGDERRQIAGAGELMIFGRGSSQGVRPGQRLTIFRNTLGGGAPVARIGEAIAVIVRPDTSVVRIERSRDAVYVGDRAALHR